MRNSISLVVILMAFASAAQAQSSDYKRFELFGGYSHNRVDTGNDNSPSNAFFDEREGFNGFEASVTGNLSRYLGLKFDLSGHFKSKERTNVFSIVVDSQLYNFLGGIQVKNNSAERTLKPFAHTLVGVAHARNRATVDCTNSPVCPLILPAPGSVVPTQNDTGFAAAVGGGLDIRTNDRIDIRVIQLDYNPTRVFDNTSHNFRIGVGIVFH